MSYTTKYILYVFLLFLLLGIPECFGQRRNNNRNKKTTNKNKGGGKFVPGRTQLRRQSSSSNPRARGPTLGDILRATGRGSPNRGTSTVDHTNPDEVNRRNYLNNLKNNNKANNNNAQSNTNPQAGRHPNIGRVIPPLRRSEGEKPPFAPSWTHCVISVQVSIAWVVVKSPHYPNKFQGQVQCSWMATAPEGYRVRLSFKDLDLLVPNGDGCGNQFVEVIDMSLQKSQARFCGTDIPGDYVSEGNKLRLDLQADAISTPYKGFMAAFRADQEVPGRRETSYFAHGQPEVLYNPLTDAPPSNPQFTQPPRRTRRLPIVTRRPAPAIPGQRIYGSKNQPRHQKDPDKDEDKEALESSTTHLYIIIAVVLVILVAAAAAYVFKRYFYKQFKAWWFKRKHAQDGIEMENTGEDIYGNKKTQLPGNMPLPPTPNQQQTPMLKRQNMSFPGVQYSETMMPGMYPQGLPPSYHSSFGSLGRSHSLDDLTGNWMQPDQEPVYEDDTMSLHSIASSVRSSNRHPDHDKFKRQKMMERQNSLLRRRNSIGAEFAMGHHHPSHPPTYPLHNPHETNSLYGEPTYGYHALQGVYGSLPPTMGPGANSHYELYPSQPVTSRPLYTSSMSNLNAGNTGNFMMQQYNGRSASVYDLTSAMTPQVPDMTSQWSTQLNQRHSSLTSSTNNSTGTNPILKKTNPEPQNELAFSALRAAKSMNDLTAINTKLNECVSWTLPSQRRKSFVDLPR